MENKQQAPRLEEDGDMQMAEIEQKMGTRRIVGSSELAYRRDNVEIRPIFSPEGHIVDFDALEIALDRGIIKTLDLKP